MRAKNLILGLVFLIFFINFFGCKCNCDDEMAQKRNEYGPPEEVETYSESGYNAQTWWYWSKGISFTFKWGSDISGCCDVSTYTFTPISVDASAEEKAEIKNSKKLKDRRITLIDPIK